MKKIVVYGVYSIELRRKVENFLCENEYKIVAYSDSYLSKDILDERMFVSKGSLQTIDYDFIIIAIDNEAEANRVKRELLEAGIDKNKIIVPSILTNKKCMYQKDLVSHIDNVLDSDIDLLIFGLSYSLRGIVKERLILNSFDFSWHGLDIYYNLMLLKYALNNKQVHASTALLVFPYYYFNYDMSKSKHQYLSGQILSVSKLKDYHNADTSDEIVRNFIVNMELFGANFLEYYKGSENIYNNKVITDEKEVLGHVWKKFHRETWDENIVLFDRLYTILSKLVKRIIIVIPPFYLKGIGVSNEELLEYVGGDRKLFYNAIENYNVEIYDLMDSIQEYEYFADATHLNYQGALRFTSYINDILKNFKEKI